MAVAVAVCDTVTTGVVVGASVTVTVAVSGSVVAVVGALGLPVNDHKKKSTINHKRAFSAECRGSMRGHKFI